MKTIDRRNLYRTARTTEDTLFGPAGTYLSIRGWHEDTEGQTVWHCADHAPKDYSPVVMYLCVADSQLDEFVF